MSKNKYNLSRKIPSEVKRKIRQNLGFGLYNMWSNSL